jgi:hypothetical protein
MAAAKKQSKADHLMSQAEFARYREVSRTAVSKWVKAGRISLVNGKVDPVAASIALMETSDPVQMGSLARGPSSQDAPNNAAQVSGPGGEVLSFAKARAMNESYKAALGKLEFRRRKGELVEAADVKREAFQAGRQVRDRLLTIPARVSSMCAAESDPRAIQKMLDLEFAAALEGLPSE